MRRFLSAALIAALAVAAGWRFVDLQRDPPIVTESSQDAWGDPAFYLYNARSHALFGDWRAAEGLSLFITPGYAFLGALWFAVFGAGYTPALILTILSGFAMVCAVAVLAAAAAHSDGLSAGNAAAAAAASLLWSYVFFGHQFVPNADMETGAIVCIGGAALAVIGILDPHRDARRFRIAAFVGGSAAGLAPFIKLSAVLFSVGVVLAWVAAAFFPDQDWRRRWRVATPFVALGFGLSLFVWAAWFLWLFNLTGAGEFLRQYAGLQVWFTDSPAAASADARPALQFAPGRFLHSNLFYRQPLETLMAALALPLLLIRGRWNWPLFLSAAWLLAGAAVMSVMTIHPLRYRMLLWPAAVVLASHVLCQLRAGARWDLGSWQQGLVYGFAGLVVAYVAAYWLSVRFPAFNLTSSPARFSAAVVEIAPVAGGMLWLVFERILRPPRLLAAVIVALAVLTALPQWIGAERNISHELRDAGAELLARYPQVVFGGGWGVRFALGGLNDAYLEWTPQARENVAVVVEDPLYMKDAPLPWHEVYRVKSRRFPLEIVVAEIPAR